MALVKYDKYGFLMGGDVIGITERFNLGVIKVDGQPVTPLTNKIYEVPAGKAAFFIVSFTQGTRVVSSRNGVSIDTIRNKWGNTNPSAKDWTSGSGWTSGSLGSWNNSYSNNNSNTLSNGGDRDLLAGSSSHEPQIGDYYIVARYVDPRNGKSAALRTFVFR